MSRPNVTDGVRLADASIRSAYFYWYTIVRRTYVKKFFPALPNASLNTMCVS